MFLVDSVPGGSGPSLLFWTRLEKRRYQELGIIWQSKAMLHDVQLEVRHLIGYRDKA